MSYEITIHGLNFQTWFLIGIAVYVLFVLLIILIRQCIVSDKCYCTNCETGPPLFCCRISQTDTDTASCLPTWKVKCFAPKLSYCSCLCCECAINNTTSEV